jgi:hypothetical protein
MKTPKLFKKISILLSPLKTKQKTKQTRNKPKELCLPVFKKKNESKIKKLKSVLEKKCKEKNVSKELRTYLKNT